MQLQKCNIFAKDVIPGISTISKKISESLKNLVLTTPLSLKHTRFSLPGVSVKRKDVGVTGYFYIISEKTIV